LPQKKRHRMVTCSGHEIICADHGNGGEGGEGHNGKQIVRVEGRDLALISLPSGLQEAAAGGGGIRPGDFR